MTADTFRLQRRLTQASQMGVAPALALGVIHGKEHQRKTWFAGHLDDGGNGTCNEKTIFDLASLTKPLTTTLWLLRLVQELTAERDEAREKLRTQRASGSAALMEEIERLQKENAALVQETANMYAVMDQNRALNALIGELRPLATQHQAEGTEVSPGCLEST